MVEKKKSNGAGKFVLGAAIGAAVTAIAGKFISKKKGCGDKCNCGCKDGKKCECKKSEKKAAKK